MSISDKEIDEPSFQWCEEHQRYKPCQECRFEYELELWESRRKEELENYFFGANYDPR